MQITGTAGNDSLAGSITADTLEGGAGNDTLNGSFGSDSLDGGAGDDRFELDYGNDTMRGGAGADIFVFNSATGNDLVVDFDPAVDRIDTSGWAGLRGVTLRLDAAGNTVLSLAGISNITLQGVGQPQWSRLLEPNGNAIYTVVADDYVASTATTGRVTVGGTASTGSIETAGDKDWFAVDVTAGSNYSFTLSGVGDGGGTLLNPYLELLSATGTVLAFNDNEENGVGLRSQINYTATGTGTLYLSAAASPSLTSGTGTYRLSATVGPTDDYAGNNMTAGRLVADGVASTGSVEYAGDKDWFAIAVTAGTQYRFTLSGVDGSGGTLANPYLELRSATGGWLASDDNGGVLNDSQLIYTATGTGTLYLSAGSSSTSGLGTYRLSAAIIPPPATDDYAASTATAGVVTVGGTAVTGSIEKGGDQDWFAVDVVEGGRYRFDLSGIDGGGGTLSDPYLTLRSSAGIYLAAADGGGTGMDSALTYTATSTGRLYLQASTLAARTSDIGTYRLSATLVAAPITDDYAATTATTGVVTVDGAAVAGSIEKGGDADWFAVDVTAGTRYRFTLSGKDGGGGTVWDPYLELRSSTGALLTSDDNGGTGNDSRITYLATSTGRLYLSARGDDSTISYSTGTYSLSARTIVDDYAASTATTGVVTVGGAVVAGAIETAGDKDWFAVDVTAGSRYYFQLDGVYENGLVNPELELLSANGTRLAFDQDSGPGLGSLITYTATGTGRLYLSAGIPSYETTTTGSYRLSAFADDYTADTATAGRLDVGGSVTGAIEVEGDKDWVAIDVTAGMRYRFSLSGKDGGGGTLADPSLVLYSETGTVLASDGNGGAGNDSLLAYTATVTGRLYVGINAGVQITPTTGTYRLSASAYAGGDDFAGSTATLGSLAVGGSVTGDLEVAADQDWFAVDLVAGKTYSFGLLGYSSDNGSLQDPWLRILDAQGTQLAYDDDGGALNDSLLTFTATASGRYYLSAEGATDKETGFYRLTASVVEPPAPDPAGPLGGTPTDPLYARQWHLNGNYGINVLPVWADYTGAGIRVGVLDQGVETIHRDLDDNLLSNLSVVAATGVPGGTPRLADDNHGTAVAGVIAGERNGYGGVGVAYNADLVAYYDPLNSTIVEFAATAQAAFLRAIGTLDVLNNSWGFGNFFKSTPNRAFLDDFDSNPFDISGAALARLATEGRGGKGTVVVQAAGNTGQFGDDTNLHNFQNSRFVITVAATDSNGALAGFSTPGASVLVAAPGIGIITTDRSTAIGYEAGDSATLDGTSFSAPAVSGVVALMLEANPDLGYRDVQEILALSARQVSATASSWNVTGASTWNGGAMHYSEGFGFGLVDARAAVRLAETWHGQQTRSNEAVLSASATLAPVLAIPDDNVTGVSTTLSLAGDLTIDRVEVDLSIAHGWIGDLLVTLTSPSGTTFALVDRPGQGRLSNLGSSQDNVGFTFGVAGLLGEQAAGEWRLSLSDRDGGIVGSLSGWSLRAYGNAGSADDNHVFTDEFVPLLAADARRGTITDTDGGYDSLNAAAVTASVNFNLAAGTGSIGDKGISFTAGAFERAVGGEGADVLTAATGGSALLGGRGADTLTGGSGGDRLTGGTGDDRITGGGGIDIAFYDNPRGNFTLARDGDGFLLTGPEGADRLGQVEVLVFNRGALFLSGPGVSFYDEATYLANNPDVAAAVQAGVLTSGRAHYDAFGRAEGRSGLDWFDEDYYLTQYTDIADAVRAGALSSGLSHWLSNGKAEGRNPSLFFDTAYYLAKNPDVAGAVRAGAFTAIDHYLSYGMAEGRAATPFFNATAYLAANPDVAAAGLNGLKHFLDFGAGEGRLSAVDWDYFG